MIEVENLVKRYGNHLAVDHLTFQVEPGKIYGFLGPNGAGKSTTMNMMTGYIAPTEGTVRINGFDIQKNAEEAKRCIGYLPEIPPLYQDMTVLEYLRFAAALKKIPKKEVEKQLADIMEMTMTTDVSERLIKNLSKGYKQRVGLAQAILGYPEVIILDEPTAVLTPQETRELFVNLRKMADDGCAVVFISHKLNEVEELADRVTVLRGGCVTGSAAKEDMHRDKLVQMMIGREVLNTYEKNCEHCGEVVLQLEQVSALNDMNTVGLNNVRLAVRAGEIYGIAGVSGNGQRELAEVLAGLRPAMGGKIFFYGQDLTNKKPKEMIEAGISYVPEDRLGMGLVPNLDSVNNVILKEYDGKFSKGWRIRREAAIAATKRIVEDFDVKLGSIFQPVKMMSGGNLQKLLLGREIAAKPKLMIVLYPVRGLDIGAIEAVHKLLLQLKEEQTAIILVSEELEEIAKLADRVGVMFAGQILGEFPVSEMDTEKIGALMAGITEAGGAGV